MICYRDTTFCVSPNCENKCGRKLTPEIVEQARKWWDGDNAPIAISCFCDNPERDDLRDNTDKTTEMNPSGAIWIG